MRVDALLAADFPRHGAELAAGFGDEEAVEGAAVAVHFFVGGCADGGVGDRG